MLRELAVQNLAVIEDVRVELDAGFCAWTGETGAGKSLLLGALGLLLGERGTADVIRTSADELRVTGRFELVRPDQKQVVEAILNDTLPDDELVISRRLAKTGRSSAWVNEQPVAIGTLRRLGDVLVDVHGQRESYSLLQPAYQLELLDAFGKLTPLRERYCTLADQVREIRRRHRDLMDARANRQRELALLRFEQEELEAAQLEPGELASLQQEREKKVHAQSLTLFASGVAGRLYDEDGSVVETLGRLCKEAGTWRHLDPRIEDLAVRLETLRPEIQDLAETARDLSDQFDSDPERLEAIEQRIQLLKRLETKYQRPLEELIAYRDTLESRAVALQQQEDDLAAMEKAIRPIFKELHEVALQLSQQRAKVSKKLVGEAEKHLADLQMPNARLDAMFLTTPLPEDPFQGELPAMGIDQLEFTLSANPGEPARPLRKVASGGEMSRTMLALKTVLAAHDPVRTLVVFDEIDANVGGRLGDVLGKKLALLGTSHQVLCVTHLPQVASYAQSHWAIRKTTTGKKTSTTILPLCTDEERIEELAMMLRGESRSSSTRHEASEMLQTARKQFKAKR